MKLLILGGTIFLGRQMVAAALAAGHEVTIFHRGRHNPDLFPECEKILGDRETNLEQLNGREWDAVIDTCGYLPRLVRISASSLRDKVRRYLFISTESVYRDFREINITEDYPLAQLAKQTETVDGSTYGALKALCEKEVLNFYPENSLIIRPGLIVGPFDPTHRFTYWPVRFSLKGEVLAPGNPDNCLQFIDGRDLAEWAISLLEQEVTGIFNATGPKFNLTMGNFLTHCRDTIDPESSLIWINDKFLLENEVTPWSDLPLWLPHNDEMKGFNRVSISRALDKGLRFRKLAETIRDTLEWWQFAGLSLPDIFGKKYERENELLQLWQNRKGG